MFIVEQSIRFIVEQSIIFVVEQSIMFIVEQSIMFTVEQSIMFIVEQANPVINSNSFCTFLNMHLIFFVLLGSHNLFYGCFSSCVSSYT